MTEPQIQVKINKTRALGRPRSSTNVSPGAALLVAKYLLPK